jgi:L-ascorbate metabolism protein UlaG (beta-lactamase superfamily)
LIGHATVLLQVAGLNILTDPVWSERAGPLSWLGVRRVRPPAIAFDDLPPIDVILLSHSHYGHLDRPTLAALERRDLCAGRAFFRTRSVRPQQDAVGRLRVGNAGGPHLFCR